MRVRLLLGDLEVFDSGERDHHVDTVKAIAAAYCEMTDDEQAKFFEEVAQIMRTWRAPSYGHEWQQYKIGQHMAECACITDAGREFFRNIAHALGEPRD